MMLNQIQGVVFSVAEKLLFELEGMLKATFKNPINVDTYEVTAVTAISDIYILTPCWRAL